jgi:hypothetical protein
MVAARIQAVGSRLAAGALDELLGELPIADGLAVLGAAPVADAFGEELD